MCMFLDLAMAFDTVDQAMLFKKAKCIAQWAQFTYS